MKRLTKRRLVLALSVAIAGSAMASERDYEHGMMTSYYRNHSLAEGEEYFTRMFPELPPFAERTDEVRGQAQRLGQKGGILDAQDNLTDPIKSITEPAVFSPDNPDNPSLAEGGGQTAGMTFVGQFLDHDVTMDQRSLLMQNADPHKTVNFRTAAFDLDSVYGAGPDGSPELYDSSSGGIKLRVGHLEGSEKVSRKGAPRADLPRDENNVAILGDARNDENVILSQLHVAMLRFHNAVVDRLKADKRYRFVSNRKIFAMAQQSVRWHYQWIITHEFLPNTIGQELTTALLSRGPRYYNAEASRRYVGFFRRGQVRMPIEFSLAYRFGHTQIRPSYRINFGADPDAGGKPVFLFIFDASIDSKDSDPNDLRGGRPAPRRFVDWQTFFNFGDGNVRPNKTIDTKLSAPLFQLPGLNGPVPGLAIQGDGVESLASRNLIRHVNFGVPSGQAIARRIGAPVLTAEQLSDLKPFGMDHSTPLWLYALREAQVMEKGKRLGPVGATIVGEVFAGLLKADPTSYVRANPYWKPQLPSATPGDFRMTDLLKFAGVVPPLS